MAAALQKASVCPWWMCSGAQELEAGRQAGFVECQHEVQLHRNNSARWDISERY